MRKYQLPESFNITESKQAWLTLTCVCDPLLDLQVEGLGLVAHAGQSDVTKVDDRRVHVQGEGLHRRKQGQPCLVGINMCCCQHGLQ